MTKNYYSGCLIVFMALLASTFFACGGSGGGSGGGGNSNPGTSVTLIGKIVDPVNDAPVPDATVSVRDKSNATLSSTISLADGSYNVTVPAQQDIYIDVSKPGYTSLNTVFYNFRFDMQGNLPIILSTDGKSIADAFNNRVLGNSWSDASYSGTCWFLLEILDLSDNEVKGITVNAEPGVPTIVYNNGSDFFSTTGPSWSSSSQPQIGGFGGSAGFYTLFLIDTQGHSQNLKIPMVPGEMTYAYADWTYLWSHSVSGKVKTTSGSGVDGVTVSLMTGSYAQENTVTVNNGNYTINGQVDGSFTITPSSGTGSSFTPAVRTITIAGGNISGQDFVIDQAIVPLTGGARYVSGNAATLYGSYTTPFATTTSAWFEYGVTISYGSATSPFELGGAQQMISSAIGGLAKLTTYHYRLVASTGGIKFYGNDKTFTTPAPPEEILLSGLDLPVYLAVDAANLYWSDRSSISKLSKNDQSVTVLASSRPSPLVVDASSVYWTDYDIKKMSLNGGTVTTLAPSGSSNYIAIDANNVYFTFPYISMVSKNGGTTTSFTLSGGNAGIAVDSSSVYWAVYGAIGSGYGNGGSVKKVALTGGPVITLAAADYAYSIAADSTSVYYCDGGLIKKIDTNSGIVTSLTSVPNCGFALTIDSTYIYWIGGTSDNSGLALYKVSKAGGTITTLALLPVTNYYSIVVDDNYVYWATWDYGEIRRVPKSY